MLKRLIKYVPIKSVRHHLKANYIDVPLQQEIAKHLDETYVKPFIEMHYQSVVDNYNNHAFDNTSLFVDTPSNRELIGKNIIWQYWGTGVETAPVIVQKCIESVKKFKGDYIHIILTDDTIGNYLKFPNYIQEKLTTGQNFKIAHYADLLRLALLSIYGGLWLDATVLMTRELDQDLYGQDFFSYQRDSSLDEETKKKFEKSNYIYFNFNPNKRVRFLSSILESKPNHPIIVALREMMFDYWKQESSFPQYFVFQILFNTLISHEEFAKYNCKLVSDTLPHELALVIKDKFNNDTWNKICKDSCVHKLTYFKKYRKDSSCAHIKGEFPYFIKPNVVHDDITFCTMCFNLKKESFSNHIESKSNYSYYLDSLVALCKNYPKMVVWCDKETSDVLEQEGIVCQKRVLELNELPHFDKYDEYLGYLKAMAKKVKDENIFTPLLTNADSEKILKYILIFHTKIDLIKWAKDHNQYNSKYFFWIDAGTCNPVYYKFWKSFNGTIDVETDKLKCAINSDWKDLDKGFKEVSYFDIAACTKPIEILDPMFVINKDIVDKVYEAYQTTFKMMTEQKLICHGQAIFTAMAKYGFRNLYELKPTRVYRDVMSLVCTNNNK